MKLLTKEILKKLPKLYSQPAHDDLSQEMVFYVKLFTPDSNWTWFIAEYDPETEIAWGLVKGLEQEYGSFDMKEIKEIRGITEIQERLFCEPRYKRYKRYKKYKRYMTYN